MTGKKKEKNIKKKPKCLITLITNNNNPTNPWDEVGMNEWQNILPKSFMLCFHKFIKKKRSICFFDIIPTYTKPLYIDIRHLFHTLKCKTKASSFYFFFLFNLQWYLFKKKSKSHLEFPYKKEKKKISKKINITLFLWLCGYWYVIQILRNKLVFRVQTFWRKQWISNERHNRRRKTHFYPFLIFF